MSQSTKVGPPAKRVEDGLRDGLFRLGRVMSKVDDLNQLLHTIIAECNRMLRCEASSVALYDAERDDLVFTVAEGGAEEGIKQWRIGMGQGIVGRVAQSREALISNDPRNDPRWFGDVDVASGFVTRSLAAVPMVRSGNLVGVLEALNHTQGGFAPEDLLFLQIFADQAATALEIHRLIRAKQESERLATLAVAIADIGHSTKNMVMRMDFPVQLIDRYLSRGDYVKVQEAWDIMKDGMEDIRHLVLDMLEYSKLRRPALAEVDVVETARTVLDGCHAEAEARGITLTLEVAEGVRCWNLDPGYLPKALHNLVGNALEAIAESSGSRVVVRLEASANTSELLVRVADDGPGIPPEVQRRVFDPFFSTKGKEGTGLGLASVKKGIEEHGGRVSLVSTPGQGAAFTLFFPKTALPHGTD